MLSISRKSSKNFITKGNALIEARYRLTLQESHVILWLLTQINFEDEDFKLHKLEISEFSKMVGLKSDGQYTELQAITSNLMRRILKIYEPNTNDIIQVAWLSFAKYQTRKGCVLLRFDPGLKPYLLQLKNHFTKIDIIDTLKLKSVYSIRIFELLLQYISIGKREISVDDLKFYCGIEKNEYTGYGMLKRKVIEKAKLEINAKTEYDIDYKELKESRKVVAIEWTIRKKNIEIQEHLHKKTLLQKELRSQNAAVDILNEYGFGKTTAKRMITLHGEEVVKNAIRAVDLQIERNRARNPKAMLQTAIQEKWHPEVFKQKKKL